MIQKLICLVAGMMLAGGAFGQTQGIDPLSPEVPAFDPSDLSIHGTGCMWTAVWTLADLGLPPGSNVDAFSDGADVFPAAGPITPGWPIGVTQRFVLALFSVDRQSEGLGAVATQSSGNGASSDIFAVEFVTGAGGAFQWSDAKCLTPNPPPQSDIDSLCWISKKKFPVFFSVDAATGATIGVGPDDILVATAPGTWGLFIPGFMLGLVPGDNIDALAVGSGGVAYSLDETSPTALAIPIIGSGGIFANGGLWASSLDCGLKATDDMNALMIGDPWESHYGTQAIPGLGIMCVNTQTGSTYETSVWRRFETAQWINSFGGQAIVSGVRVGAELVELYDFDVEVRLWGADDPNPSSPRTLLAGNTQTYSAGMSLGSMVMHPFDDVPIQHDYLWVEMRIPDSPGLPNDGRFFWAATDSESEPSFFSSPACSYQDPVDLDSIGFPQSSVMMTVVVRNQWDLQHIQGALVAGGQGSMAAVGADPFELVHFVYSLSGIGAGPCVPILGGLCLDVVNPVQLLTSQSANAEGVALVQLPVSSNVPPIPVATQAVLARGAASLKSNPVLGTVQ
ncbi:MAG: hypothetical protein DWQ01_17875 [Planctomycetota bacterium]|nr:MAG: hypothetical protein DWQ01_17875 [Planctomycetota bacterium]